MMGRMRMGRAAALAALAGLSVGCATAMVPVPPGVARRLAVEAAATPSPVIPSLDLGHAGGGRIALRLGRPDFAVQAQLPRTASDVIFYELELIRDQGAGSATDYSNATLGSGGHILATIYVDGPASTPPSNGGGYPFIIDSGTAGRMQFINVPPGTYRVRAKASSAPAVGPIGATAINKPDGFFTNADGWAISSNTATVTFGVPMASYSTGSELNLVIDLHDGAGDALTATVNVTSGNAIPSIGGGNGNI